MPLPLFDDLDVSPIQDERARQFIVRLLNLVEEVTAALRAAQEENQRLRDAINRFTGEHGKPMVKGNTPLPPRAPPNDSSEQELQGEILGEVPGATCAHWAGCRQRCRSLSTHQCLPGFADLGTSLFPWSVCSSAHYASPNAERIS